MSEKRRSLKESKEEKRARKRRARRKKRIIFLLTEIIILALLLGVAYVMAKYDKFQIKTFGDDDIKVNKGANQKGYTTIALFGGDSRDGALEEGTHADTIIIAAIDNESKEVKMVSLYRDTLTKQADESLKKANNAYFVGGPKDAINMLNENFDLDIKDYVSVDFKAMTDTIDILGGVEVEVTQAEADEMNNYISETAKAAGKEAHYLDGEGVYLLDGVQATTYARIRKNVGGDYQRTERQRLVIQKMAEKAKGMNLKAVDEITNVVFPKISTSFSLADLLSLGASALQYNLGESKGFPFELTDGNIDPVGSVVIPLGLVENVEELHDFLYPKDDYQVSEEVKEIAVSIEEFTGYTREDYTSSGSDIESNE